MNPQILPLFPFFSLLLILITLVPEYLSSLDEFYRICGGTFSCGTIREVGYPFRRDDGPEFCGYPGLVLHCDQDITTINISNMRYHVLSIDQSAQSMKIVREDVVESTCPLNFVNATLDLELFDYVSTYMNLTLLYGCPAGSIDIPGACLPSCGNTDVCIADGIQGPGRCNASVVVPVSINALGGSFNYTGWDQAVREGFEVRWKVDGKACRDCAGSKGKCGHDLYTNKTACYCPDPPYVADTCSAATKAPSGSSPSTGRRNKGVTIATVAVVLGIVVFVITAFVCFIWKFKLGGKYMLLWWKKTEKDQNIENFLNNYGSLAPKRYSYSDVKKMTNSFNTKLGQGGYGHVYKGRLCNDNLVAVKILNGSKGNGEDFINEVASISRTSHVNIVNLLGFCIEGHKRALVYEFMPNGSLEKFIYDRSSLEGRQLGWGKLYQIAVGIARGLEYLHRGCNTRILHFDIKPHNILLDENFCPKVADFGLAKLCPEKESILSTVTARGTLGYIAPEVFCRNFGGVSHKSDVYSYGMMVSEMVGGRKNVDVEVAHTSEIYFPHWIFKQLESNNELPLHGIVKEEENEIARKMVIVSLWCIQTDPVTRPSMTKVLEMLEGSLESLQIPPKPYLSSPPRSPAGSQTMVII